MSTPSQSQSLPRDFEIARKVGHVTETCNYGCEHQIDYVESHFVSPTGETREYDNGYSKDQTPLVADRNGRIYHSHPPTDMYGSTIYVRDDDKARFTRRPSGNPERLLSGHGVKNCPDGPKWSEVTDPVVTDETAVEAALRTLGLEPTPRNIRRFLALKDGSGDEQEGQE